MSENNKNDSSELNDELNNLLNPKEKVEEVQANPDNKIIIDINIKTVDDLLDILLKKQYDFLTVEPFGDYVKIIYKKDSIVKEEKYVKYVVYSNILLNAKKISKLDISKNDIEQKGVGEYEFNKQFLEILVKVVPSTSGEILFLKTRVNDKKVDKKTVTKQPISAGKAFSFIGALLFIVLILGGTFVSFVVFNAKTPADVSFFGQLGINLNDVNGFLARLSTFIFSIVLFLETIVLVIFLFKALLTKKIYKRKKIVSTIVSIFLLILTFSTGTLWLIVDAKIKNLPNWQEMSMGDIQVYDNSLLLAKDFGKSNALITDFANIIGPIDLKFDLKNLKQSEARKGFEIKKYVWNLGNGETKDTFSPELIYSFKTKGINNIKLTLEGYDSRIGKTTTKEVDGMPVINVEYLVEVKEKTLGNGLKTYEFNATDLDTLGQIEWYLSSKNSDKPLYTGTKFIPGIPFSKTDYVGMRINNDTKKSFTMDRVFVVGGEVSDLTGEIKAEVSVDSDLDYTFSLANLKDNFGEGFVESVTWNLEDKEINQKIDILKPEESSKINYTFKEYGKHTVKAIITNSSGKTKEIQKEVNIAKKINLTQQIEFLKDDTEFKDFKYDTERKEYNIYGIGVPAKFKFDTKMIRADNPLYKLNEVKWDIGNTGEYKESGFSLEKTYEKPGTYEIGVIYKFVHRRDATDIVEIKEKINIECVEQDALLDLNIKPESDYAPTNVAFDASLSKVKNDSIAKFIFDYGDGQTEERTDAINKGHKYLTPGTYIIKLKVITESGKEYSFSKNLVLKKEAETVKIDASLKKAPVNQEITFTSYDSIGQINSYLWDFGDGTIATTPQANHSYSQAGTYKVKLTLEFVNKNVLSSDIDVEITE